MGYRLSKIYTRTGDKGTTGLGDGSRISKDSPRIEAIGCVDELNSLIGLLAAQDVPTDIHQMLQTIQHRLFDIGGELAVPGYSMITSGHIERLEQFLDQLNDSLPPLQEFILPGGNIPASSCHHARAVCRRAERRVTHLGDLESETLNPLLLQYLNRLSDLLFVVARTLARAGAEESDEIYWSKEG